MINLWILLIGMAAGALSGIVGIGGGIVIVPAMVWLLGMNQHRAQGTSLGALLAPVGLLAFFQYYRHGNADLHAAFLVALGFLIGGWMGGSVAQQIPDLWLRRLFALVLIGIGGRMLLVR